MKETLISIIPEKDREVFPCTELDADGNIVAEKTRYIVRFGGDFGEGGKWECWLPNGGFKTKEEAEELGRDDARLFRLWHQGANTMRDKPIAMESRAS